MWTLLLRLLERLTELRVRVRYERKTKTSCAVVTVALLTALGAAALLILS